MKMNEPIGNPAYAPLVVRLPLGAYFVAAGWSKLHQLAGFVVEVKKMGVLPENVAALYGTMLPYAEIAVGAMLFLGLWTTLASILASLMLFSFVAAFGFMSGEHSKLFNKDLLLLGAAMSLMFSGGGKYSIDNIRQSGGVE